MTYFADTFYFLAILNPSDAAHARARQFATSRPAPILTTEWILTELADGMSAGRQRQAVITLVHRLALRPDVQIVSASHDLFAAAWDLYTRRPDKEWSLTDCTSFVVMQRHGLTDALTGDHHFEQAGFTVLFK